MIRIAAAWFILGLLFFYTGGVFDKYNSLPNWIYYWWDKGLVVLLWLGIYFVAYDRLRRPLKPIIIFSIIRLVWDIVSFSTGVSIANSQAMSLLFLLLTLVVLWIYLKE